MANDEQQIHDKIVDDAKGRFGDALLEVERPLGDLVLIVNKSAVYDVLTYLRDEQKCDLLLDVIGVDLLELEPYRERFEVEYILYSRSNDMRVQVRIPVPESDLDVPTVSTLWQSANWGERECYEMYGINFVGHPCLKRLLTHHEFEGHPLRKDYPLMGAQWCTTSSDMTDELAEEQGGAPRD